MSSFASASASNNIMLPPVVSMSALGLLSDHNNNDNAVDDANATTEEDWMNMMDFDLDAMLNEAINEDQDNNYNNYNTSTTTTTLDVSTAVAAAVATTSVLPIVPPAMIPTQMDTSLIDDPAPSYNHSQYQYQHPYAAFSPTSSSSTSSTGGIIPNPLSNSHLFASSSAAAFTNTIMASPTITPRTVVSSSSSVLVEIAPRATANVSPSPSSSSSSNNSSSNGSGNESCSPFSATSATAFNNNKRKRLSKDSINSNTNCRTKISKQPSIVASSSSNNNNDNCSSSSIIHNNNNNVKTSTPYSPSQATTTSSSNNAKANSNESRVVDLSTMTNKKERNRLHAQASRERRKALTTEMQDSLQALQHENRRLVRFLQTKLGGKAPTQRALLHETAKPNEQLVRMLQTQQQPTSSLSSCRVLNAKTLRFLQELRQTVVDTKEDQRHDNDGDDDSSNDDAASSSA